MLSRGRFIILSLVSLFVIALITTTVYAKGISGLSLSSIKTNQAVPVKSSGADPHAPNVAVLMYHHIMDKPTQDGIISTKQFEEQMRLLKEQNYHVIGLDQYRDFILHGAAIPDKAVLITFDDGYESFYKLAYPILKKYGYSAVSFVIVSRIDHPVNGEIPKMTWDQLREMKQNGIALMNHTYDLHKSAAVNAAGGQKPMTVGKLYLKDQKRQETDAEYQKRLSEDLKKAEDRLKDELGNTYGALAFPYGAYNDELLKIVKNLGIDLTFTVKPGLTDQSNANAYRINMGRSDVKPEEFMKQLGEFEAGKR
ncbi:polysaccharide deacetylase family protein [Paenibacillus glycanilyticus]|uniref:polysaccharide deacetylase family protein n=1 Tax=Paenibacillus glycanilyticus TaxID=126569 RepID=UPI002041C6DC|nr:polysaccharide deacetylase family protein [Paenibacillus glycanilyticus]MCM3630777.1 polysaccharide deacetylase family protein [Paenibacillus glycanilyticus]